MSPVLINFSYLGYRFVIVHLFDTRFSISRVSKSSSTAFFDASFSTSPVLKDLSSNHHRFVDALFFDARFSISKAFKETLAVDTRLFGFFLCSICLCGSRYSNYAFTFAGTLIMLERDIKTAPLPT